MITMSKPIYCSADTCVHNPTGYICEAGIGMRAKMIGRELCEVCTSFRCRKENENERSDSAVGM